MRRNSVTPIDRLPYKIYATQRQYAQSSTSLSIHQDIPAPPTITIIGIIAPGPPLSLDLTEQALDRHPSTTTRRSLSNRSVASLRSPAYTPSERASVSAREQSPYSTLRQDAVSHAYLYHSCPRRISSRPPHHSLVLAQQNKLVAVRLYLGMSPIAYLHHAYPHSGQ